VVFQWVAHLRTRVVGRLAVGVLPGVVLLLVVLPEVVLHRRVLLLVVLPEVVLHRVGVRVPMGRVNV
jgi:hypothetical protein